MHKILNEKGAALAMVLWIIVLFVILGTILSAQLMTTTNLMNKQEESTVESDIANMSAIYVSTYLKQKGESGSINQQDLPMLIADMPPSIKIDSYDVSLNPQLELELNQIRLDLVIRHNKEELRREVLVPLQK
ncbi:hypothetical protein SFC66_06810 [Terribacillus saccharophilus]|uniref:hypothetical protein n=1 Tax=Terribacillus saccharophilus TaxID=361277 RepID=UPI003982A99F